MDAFFVKMPNGMLMPAAEHDRELLTKIKVGQPVRLTLKRVRNYDFFRKWWALIHYAYDVWEPDPGNQVGEKNLDRFRKDITILAGYYEQTIRLDGSTRTEAKSLQFGKMTEDEFEDLYSKTIDVILKYVMHNYTGDQLRCVVDQVMEFA